MAMRINVGYFAKEAVLSFRRNLVQSLAAVTTVGLCLVVIGVILLILYVGGQLIKKLENKVEIEIFLEGIDMPVVGSEGLATGAYWGQVKELGETVRSWPEVKKVTYISKAQALAEFKKQFRKSPEVVRQIEGNPLPASYRVSLHNPRKVEQVAKRIKELPYIKNLVGDTEKNIKYGKETVRKLFAFTRWISVAAAGFASLLVFVSLVLITNTIRLAIFARRKEIGIMRLVGASNWFIRWPFLLEGMIEGAIGAIIAIAVLVGIWHNFFTDLATGKVLTFLTFSFDPTTIVQLAGFLFISGTTIGLIGSFIALRRFLKV